MAGYFVPSELESWFFATDVDDITAPTTGELAAATDITDDIAEVTGFSATAERVNTPTMKGGVIGNISGRQTLPDCALTFDEQDTAVGNTIRALFANGTNGFVIISRYTKTPGDADEVEVWPVRVAGNNRIHTVANEPAQFRVDFGATIPPELDAVITTGS